MGFVVDSLPLCVPVTCSVRWNFLDHVVWNQQNINAILVKFSNFVWKSHACSASTVYNGFRSVCHTVGALYLESDLAILEVLHVSHAVGHSPFDCSLNGLIGWFCFRSAFHASRFGCVSNWWINFWTASLRVWSCSWMVEWVNHWILKSISPRQLSLYVPPPQVSLCLLEWSKDVLASELVLSWRPQCKFCSTTNLWGKVGDWYLLLYKSSPDFLITTFSMHTASKMLQKVIAFDRVWQNCNPFLWATLKLHQ